MVIHKITVFQSLPKNKHEIWIETSVPKGPINLRQSYPVTLICRLSNQGTIQAIFWMNLNDLMLKMTRSSTLSQRHPPTVRITALGIPFHQLPRLVWTEALLKASSHITLETKDDDHHPRRTQLRILRNPQSAAEPLGLLFVNFARKRPLFSPWLWKWSVG